MTTNQSRNTKSFTNSEIHSEPASAGFSVSRTFEKPYDIGIHMACSRLFFLRFLIAFNAFLNDFRCFFAVMISAGCHFNSLKNLVVFKEIADFLQLEVRQIGQLMHIVIARIAIHDRDQLVIQRAVIDHLKIAEHSGRDNASGEGRVFADDKDFDSELKAEARRYYTNIVGKYGMQTVAAINKVSGLDIKMICFHLYNLLKIILLYLNIF